MSPQDNKSILKRLQQLEQSEQRRTRALRASSRGLCFGLIGAIVVMPAIASAVEVPHTFESGAAIVAADFNANFSALGDALTTAEDGLANLQLDVAALGPPISGSGSIDVTNNIVSLTDELNTVGDIVAGGGHIRMPIPGPSTWNNAGNGAPALTNNVSGTLETCNGPEDRGRMRIFVLDESTPDGDSRDALCFCAQYTDDTTATDTIRWECFHGPNDGS